MITFLTWTAFIAGGLLIFLLLLSLVGGLDLDLDLGDADADDGAGLGLVKGGLTFLSVGAWVVRILLLAKQHPIAAAAIGILVGVVATWVLARLVAFLLRSEENTNWSPDDALLQEAKVYLKIPAENGYGLVHVEVHGVPRELKAVSADNCEIATGERVVIQGVKEDVVSVLKLGDTGDS